MLHSRMNMKSRKPLVWIGSSKKDLLACSKLIQRMIGHSLNLAQQELRDPNSFIMRGFQGGSVREII